MKTRFYPIILVTILFAVLLSGCELLEMYTASEAQQVESASQEWMEAHDYNPVNEDGSVNVDSVLQIGGRVLTDSTGDPEEDAALDSENVVRKIVEADRLEEQAWKERDTVYLDQSIKLRPEDWRYRISRAALNMDVYVYPPEEKVDADFGHAESLLGSDKQERIAYANYGIQRMEAVKQRLSKKRDPAQPADLWRVPYACNTVFTQLAHYYNVLADQTGNQDQRQVAEQYARDASMCPEDK